MKGKERKGTLFKCLVLLALEHKSNFGFSGEGKPEFPEETSRCRVENQQTQPAYDAGSGNRTNATLVGGECSHDCAIPAPDVV